MVKHVWNGVWLGEGDVPFVSSSQDPFKWIAKLETSDLLDEKKRQRVHIVFATPHQIHEAKWAYPNAMLVVVGNPMDENHWHNQDDSLQADDVISMTMSEDEKKSLWLRLRRNLNLRQQIAESEKRAKIIGLGSELLNHLHDEKEVYKNLVQVVSQELQSKRVSLLNVNHKAGYLEFKAAIGVPDHVVQNAKPLIGEGIAGLCALRGEPIFISDHARLKGNQSTSLDGLIPKDSNLKLSDMPMSLTVPILVRGEVVGVVNITDRIGEEPYTYQDISLISALMSHAGYLMESATLIEDIKALQRFSDQVLQTLEDPLAVINESGKILKYNRIFQEIFTPNIDAMNMLLGDVLPQSDELITEMSEAWPPVAKDEHGQIALKRWGKSAWKSVNHVFDIRLIPFLSENHTPRAVLFFNDITQKYQMERQLVSAEKMASLGVLAAGIAHEINNPLGYVKTNTKQAKRYMDDLFDYIAEWKKIEGRLDQQLIKPVLSMEKDIDLKEIKDDYPQMLQDCLEGLDRIQKISTSLKSFAHPDTETTRDASISHLVDQALIITQGKWKHHLDITKDFQSDAVISCLPNQLEQVFMNLIVNSAQAAKGLDRKETLKITVTQNEQGVELLFRDTCGGIPEGYLNRIFDPFFTTKEIGEGTGLGLHIAQNIIEGHGGYIKVDSNPPVGTTFLLYLPMMKGSRPTVIKQLSRFRI